MNDRRDMTERDPFEDDLKALFKRAEPVDAGGAFRARVDAATAKGDGRRMTVLVAAVMIGAGFAATQVGRLFEIAASGEGPVREAARTAAARAAVTADGSVQGYLSDLGLGGAVDPMTVMMMGAAGLLGLASLFGARAWAR